MPIQISVVIPVYNAAKFVQQAVESALAQPETAEVILVEDASPDNSLEVCQEIADKYSNVYLFQHPNGQNRGAGPSRNLGIDKSNFPFIAFLDADDYYLPGRFSIPAQVFEGESRCDGVYEAVGIHFEDEEAKKRWNKSNMANVRLTCLTKVVPPEGLFRVLMKGGSGHIHLNGLVIKSSIIEKSGKMDESIADTLHEDVDFVFRLAAVGSLFPGRIKEPSSIRRVHFENRVSAPRSAESIYRDKMRLRVATYRWLKKHGTQEQRQLAFNRMLVELKKGKKFTSKIIEKTQGSTKKALQLFSWPFNFPEVMLEAKYWHETGSSIWGILRNDILSIRGKNES
jgi:glycosyltransferase involved in cell wall biosynthesis